MVGQKRLLWRSRIGRWQQTRRGADSSCQGGAYVDQEGGGSHKGGGGEHEDVGDCQGGRQGTEPEQTLMAVVRQVVVDQKCR